MRIVFLEDDRFYARPYVDKLRERFEVSYFDDPVDTVEFVRTNPEVDAMVVDMMMQAPRGIDPDIVNGGLSTGLWVLQQLRDHIVSRPVPVVILTHRGPESFQDELQNMKFPNDSILIARKMDTMAWRLPEIVAGHVAGNRKGAKKERELGR